MAARAYTRPISRRATRPAEKKPPEPSRFRATSRCQLLSSCFLSEKSASRGFSRRKVRRNLVYPQSVITVARARTLQDTDIAARELPQENAANVLSCASFSRERTALLSTDAIILVLLISRRNAHCRFLPFSLSLSSSHAGSRYRYFFTQALMAADGPQCTLS